MEIKIGKRIAKVSFLGKKDNLFTIKVDKKVYEIDVAQVGDMVYSILYQGASFNIEMIQGESPDHYLVNTLYSSYEIEIMDQLSRLKTGKHADDGQGSANTIITPMPAKIVKIFVKEGESVVKGQILLVVSAMKMEIEHKAPRDCKINKIKVKEDDTVSVNEVLMELKD